MTFFIFVEVINGKQGSGDVRMRGYLGSFWFGMSVDLVLELVCDCLNALFEETVVDDVGSTGGRVEEVQEEEHAEDVPCLPRQEIEDSRLEEAAEDGHEAEDHPVGEPFFAFLAVVAAEGLL